MLRQSPLLLLLVACAPQAQPIFFDGFEPQWSVDFDNDPPWQTAGRESLGDLPPGWDAGRTDEQWHPDDGDSGTKPSMLIDGTDPDQVFGDSGQAFVTYSESYNDTSNNGFTSDGMLTKDIAPTDRLYVRFKIKFKPGWANDAERGQVKIFRALSFDGGERYRFFSSGNSAPIYIYDWAQNVYGVRHLHAFRCDPQQNNYFCTAPTIIGPPRQVVTGDMSANYTSDVAALAPQLPDLVNGGVLPADGLVYHEQVFGDRWHTMEFYLQLNSAPGATDGVLQHWLDGEPLIDMRQVPWIGSDGDIDARWNSISIGGNDRFHFDLTSAPALRERWYSIDELTVARDRPSTIAGGR